MINSLQLHNTNYQTNHFTNFTMPKKNHSQARMPFDTAS